MHTKYLLIKLFLIISLFFCQTVGNVQCEQKKKNSKQKNSKNTSTEKVSPEKSILKELINLDFYQTGIKAILRILSAKSGINIIPDDNVSGAVTIHLKNVTFEEALDTILMQKRFSWEWIGKNRIRVMGEQLVTTRIFSLNYANASDMSELAKGLLSGRGKVVIDSRVNSIIISDELEYLRRIEELIKKLDVKPEQVLIEAKLIEIDATSDLDIGINWNMLNTREVGEHTVTIGGGELGSPGVPSVTQVLPSEVSKKFIQDGNYDEYTGQPLSIAQGGTGVEFPLPITGGALTVGSIADNMLLNVTLATLQKKGKTNTLSNPKIVTINNKEAKILIGDRVPYTLSTLIPGTGTTQTTAFADVGIRLEVTPTINADNKITLKVHPEVSTLRALLPEGPQIATREADTTVLVKSGETIAIGGLMTETDLENAYQVPILGSIPLVGYLFKRKTRNKEKVELIIFLTTTILED